MCGEQSGRSREWEEEGDGVGSEKQSVFKEWMETVETVGEREGQLLVEITRGNRRTTWGIGGQQHSSHRTTTIIQSLQSL